MVGVKGEWGQVRITKQTSRKKNKRRGINMDCLDDVQQQRDWRRITEKRITKKVQTEEELLILGGWGERERERDFKARIGEEGNLYNGEVGNISDQ